jgi:hypothetical protein
MATVAGAITGWLGCDDAAWEKAFSEARARIQSLTGIPIVLRGTRVGPSKWPSSRAAALWLAALLVLLLLATAIASTSLKAGADMLTIAAIWASGRGHVPLEGSRIRSVFNHMGSLVFC